MDDDLQNPPEEVIRLYDTRPRGDYDVVYTYYAQQAARGWRNLGSRFTNCVADRLMDKPKGLYLSSFRCMSAFVARARSSTTTGPIPYIDGLIMQVTQTSVDCEVAHLPRSSGRSNYTLRRLVRLWLLDVPQFLGDAAAPRSARRVRDGVPGACRLPRGHGRGVFGSGHRAAGHR